MCLKLKKVFYSSSYTDAEYVPYSQSGKDGWRSGLVTGNGENGLIETGNPYSNVMIFQNIKFNYPVNTVRETPEIAECMNDVRKSIINGEKEQSAEIILKNASDKWSNKFNDADWKLCFRYSYHPSHQLRITTDKKENKISNYIRYTDCETAEIGSSWIDMKGNRQSRKSFASRADNVVYSLIESENNIENAEISIDNISTMSNENSVDGVLSDIRYKKFYIPCGKNSVFIGEIGHYPNYDKSELKSGGFCGLTKLVVLGENAEISVEKGDKPSDNRTQEQIDGGVPNEEIINLSGHNDTSENGYIFNYNPTIKIKNVKKIVLITKSDRAKKICPFDEFEKNTDFGLIDTLCREIDASYNHYCENGVFDYNKALKPHVKIHSEIFNRMSVDLGVPENERNITNEELIELQQNNNSIVLGLLERLCLNGRYANICCSGIQAPRLGGMWTGTWCPQWGGDYTTDANINLQVAGNNIENLKEATIGFINLMLKSIVDWEINAKAIYGIDNALLAPPGTDGDRAVLTHYHENFPGEVWNSGASWLLSPIYEYYQCFGNVNIELTPEIREQLMIKSDINAYPKALPQYRSLGNEVIYNLRRTLNLSDEQADMILDRGYFDFVKDILHPLLSKQANFWLGIVSPMFYTDKDGKAHYCPEHTQLDDNEKYIITPSYSPENRPSNTGRCITANAVMDISAAKSGIDMAMNIDYIVNGYITDKAKEWEYLKNKLPDYLYEPNGELKEWALKAYDENYDHRHVSQMYAAWPAYESNTNKQLFEGILKTLLKKEKYAHNDNRAAHGFLHRCLIYARLKNGEGVKKSLMPMLMNNMIYSSLMMAHNTDGTMAYCTDPVITIPAIIMESFIYSDSKTIELLPALIPDIPQGCIKNAAARTGAKIDELSWNKDNITLKITGGKGNIVSLNKPFKQLLQNGIVINASNDLTIADNQTQTITYIL